LDKIGIFYDRLWLGFQDGIGNAARMREPSSELSILTMYDAQVGHLSLNNNGLILIINLVWSFSQCLKTFFS
jgi:hypothetical protein